MLVETKDFRDICETRFSELSCSWILFCSEKNFQLYQTVLTYFILLVKQNEQWVINFTFLYTSYVWDNTAIVKKKYHLKISTDLYSLSSLEYKEKGGFYEPSVCLYVCMNTPLASAWRVRRILFTFSIQEFMNPSLVPGEREHFSSKNEGSLDGLHDTKWHFLENTSNDFV
jgi:hypothetical protein